MKKSKLLGQVYTPAWIVQTILDEAGYSGGGILGKTVLEPACGDGAFLLEIVRRYIQAARQNGLQPEIIKNHLQTYIYGIEKDPVAHQSCLLNLNDLCQSELGGAPADWRIICGDTLLEYTKYKQYFDFILGNPPYIRIHHLDDGARARIKQTMQFASGMIDLYVSFFEMSLHMLKTDGVLGFITPNSFLHNSSYQNFRHFLQSKQNIKMLCDFKAHKVFDGFSTYTAITVIDQSQRRNDFIYKEFNTENQVIHEVNRIAFSDLNGQKWMLSDRENGDFLANLFAGTQSSLGEWFQIQYGFATLRDKIFIAPISNQDIDFVEFHGYWLERGAVRKIVKASRYRGNAEDMEWILYPYFEAGGRQMPYSETDLQRIFPLAYDYLLKNKEELLMRDLDKNAMWYEFGRSQGIQTSHQAKIAVSPMVNGAVHFFRLPEDVLVYSGIFLSAKYDDGDLQMAEDVLASDNFYRYIRLTGKDFSGGYKSVSTKQIKEYRIAARSL